MGALVVQRAARKCNAAALVLLAPVPPHGLASSVWSLASRDPALFFALNAMQIGGGVTNGMRSVRDYLFSQTLSEHDVTRYLMRLQRESQRALFELAWPQHLWIASAVGIPTSGSRRRRRCVLHPRDDRGDGVDASRQPHFLSGHGARHDARAGMAQRRGTDRSVAGESGAGNGYVEMRLRRTVVRTSPNGFDAAVQEPLSVWRGTLVGCT